MSTLKADVINMAYTHLTIFGISVGPSNEDTTFALNQLDSMMAELESRNICLGYNFQDESDVNDLLGVQLWAKNAVETNLAVRLIAAFGKMVPPTLATQANQSMSNLSARTANVRQTSYPDRMPRGSGNTLRYNRWRRYNRKPVEAPNSCQTNQLTVGEINDYTEFFKAYLREGEDIDTFTIQSGDALDIQSSSNTFTDVVYRVKALQPNRQDPTYQLVIITITTTDGRVEERKIDFNIT